MCIVHTLTATSPISPSTSSFSMTLPTILVNKGIRVRGKRDLIRVHESLKVNQSKWELRQSKLLVTCDERSVKYYFVTARPYIWSHNWLDEKARGPITNRAIRGETAIIWADFSPIIATSLVHWPVPLHPEWISYSGRQCQVKSQRQLSPTLWLDQPHPERISTSSCQISISSLWDIWQPALIWTVFDIDTLSLPPFSYIAHISALQTFLLQFDLENHGWKGVGGDSVRSVGSRAMARKGLYLLRNQTTCWTLLHFLTQVSKWMCESIKVKVWK